MSFSRDIRPLLAKSCLNCHGPDEAKREADLRLDVRDMAIATKAVVPGKGAESEMIARLLTKDPDEQMPPPGKGEALTPEQVALVRRWIDEGAEYQTHWAFTPPEAKPLPTSEPMEDFPVRSGIDSWVLQDHRQRGITPAPPVSRERWLRRATLDLTGLPPTPEEVMSFLADTRPGAEERVVEGLLARPSFGERIACDWLDVARYGDTYGRHEDYDCVTWPWRDWVIGAFNRNMPFDQFVTLQLAGDLLDGADEDERMIATAFNRLNIQTNEAGTIPEEARCTGVSDRVKTVGSAFMGLTFDCARCHDHKYDPISMRDYYSMAAFFDKIDESGMFPSLCNGVPGPSKTLFANVADEARHEALQGEMRAREAALQQVQHDAKARYQTWLQAHQPPTDQPEVPSWWTRFWNGAQPRAVAPWTLPQDAYSFDDFTDKRNFANSRNPERPAVTTRNARKAKREGGGQAVNFGKENSVTLAGAGNFSRNDPFTLSLWVKLDEHLEEGVVIHRTRGGLDAGHRGYEISIEKDRPIVRLAYYWPGNAIGLAGREVLPLGKWVHLALTYDGSSKASGTRFYRDGKLAEVELLQDCLSRDFRYYREWGDFDPDKVPDSTIVEHPELMLGARYLAKSFVNGSIDQVEVYDRELSTPEIARAAGKTVSFTSEDWFAWYLREIDEPWRTAMSELRSLRQQADALVTRGVELMVMREAQMPRRTHLLKRGAFDQPGDAMEPDTPASLLPFPADLPRDRLGFAKWLLDPKHPLTARVEVNRIWQMFFGTGLVPTAENFGTQGEAPTHPELLDWLAVQFRESGWDIKQLCRMIVLSSTYRQDSLPRDPSMLVNDPENRLLSHGERERLTAEELRDQALAASGLLATHLGGTSVRPYQPAGLWEEGGTQHTYVQDHGEALYRRSLYTFWRRTMPPPSMAVFDAPSREFCQVRRPRTTNPLQALTLLNDPEFFEAARVLAERLVQAHPAPNEGDDLLRSGDAFLRLTGRLAKADELQPLVQLLHSARAEYEKAPDAARLAITRAGEAPVHFELPLPEIAATTIMVRALLCYDECTHKL